MFLFPCVFIDSLLLGILDCLLWFVSMYVTYRLYTQLVVIYHMKYL